MAANASLACSAGYYVIIAFWWHMQIAKKYWSCKQRRVDFTSSVTFHCCSRFRNMSVEGIFKLFGSLLVVTVAIYQYQTSADSLRQKQAIGQLTVFTLYAISALLDITFLCHRHLSIPGLDYLMLVICFNVQSIALAYHTDLNYSWLSVADTCAMYAATFVAVALLFEYKYSYYVWFPLARAFMTLVLGTWCFHMFVYQWMYNTQDITMTGLGFNRTRDVVKIESLRFDEPAFLENLSLVPMYFSWHILFNVNILSVIWLLVMRLASRNCCVCMPSDEEGEITHFENRVPFNYHMITTRMADSDNEYPG